MSRADANEEVWLARSNIIEWVLVLGGVPQTDLTSLSRVVVCVEDKIIDSDVVGSTVIWWTDTVTDLELPDGTLFTGNVLRMRLGLPEAGLQEGDYSRCQLIIFSTQNVDGLLVSDNISFKVYPECAA